jgi:hypothetical protein
MIGGRKDNGNMFQKTVQVEVFSGKCDFFAFLRGEERGRLEG